MSTVKKLLGAAMVMASATGINAAHADTKSVGCNVSIIYSLNGVETQTYNRDFVVAIGQAYSEDLSTRTRQRDFSATLAPEGSNLVVTINYFSDVGVFDSASFGTQLKLSSSKNLESTAGTMTHTHVQTTGNSHTTDYALTCRRQ